MLGRVVRKIYRALPRAGRVGEVKGSMLNQDLRRQFFEGIRTCCLDTELKAVAVFVDMVDVRRFSPTSLRIDRHGRMIHEAAFEILLGRAPLDLASTNIEIHVDPRRTLLPEFLAKTERSLRTRIKRVGLNIIRTPSQSSLGVQAAHIVTNDLFRVAVATHPQVLVGFEGWNSLPLDYTFLTAKHIQSLLTGE